jgi:AcrR family transcriptional regulator
MGKGTETRQVIVERAASLFNTRGYGASMQEVLEATGLQKGGVYNHFESKDDLAAASFEFAIARIRESLTARLKEIDSPVERLRALPRAFAERYAGDGPYPNGCVVLNTTIEAKQHMPELRRRAQDAMRWFLGQFRRQVNDAVRAGELPEGTRGQDVAAVFVSILEGAMLLAVLYGDRKYLRRAIDHLDWYIDTLRRAT